MTTYRITGFFVRDNGPTVFPNSFYTVGSTSADLAVPDGTPFVFTPLEVLGNQELRFVPDPRMFGMPAAPHLLPDDAVSLYQHTLSEITWAGGTTTVLKISTPGISHGTTSYYALSGDPLPEIDSYSEYQDFLDSITEKRPVTTSLEPDQTLEWDLETVSVTEDDYFTGTGSSDTISGGAGHDTIVGRGGDDLLQGQHGSDRLFGGTGSDHLKGGGGKDRLIGNFGNDLLDGGKGADRLNGGFGDDTLLGGDGDDTLYGHKGADSLYGGNGNDMLDGWDGDDWLDGGAGNDEISGQRGKDNLFGADGDDALNGGSSSDTLRGGWGEDILWGQNGNDLLIGDWADTLVWPPSLASQPGLSQEAGTDEAALTVATLPPLVPEGAGLNDTLVGGKGDDTLHGGFGDDNLYAGRGDDFLYGGDGNDTLSGRQGSDWLSGGAGDDSLFGGPGADTLDGGQGNDLLVAHGEQNTFLFSGGFGNDTIGAFDAAEDGNRIDLQHVSEITSLEDLFANHIQQTGSDVVISDGEGNTITLTDTALADLEADHFIFSTPASLAPHPDTPAGCLDCPAPVTGPILVCVYPEDPGISWELA